MLARLEPSSSSLVALGCRRCCAELNALLNAYKHRLGELPLESFHSWTRATKDVTFAKLQQHYGALRQSQARMQLQMVTHLLGSVLCQQPELAIRKCTFNLQHVCPAWLRSWCVQWGFTSGSLTVLCIEAYPESVPKLAGYDYLGYPIFSKLPNSAAVMTTYVPCIC